VDSLSLERAKIMEPVKYLSAEDILNVDDFEYRDIVIPAWKGTIRLRSLTAQEAIDFLKEIKGSAKDEAHIKAIALVAVNGAGQQLFKPDQMAKLKTKKSAVFTQLQDVFLEMNGFKKSKEEIEVEKAAAKKED
jgi:hypothetical protein